MARGRISFPSGEREEGIAKGVAAGLMEFSGVEIWMEGHGGLWWGGHGVTCGSGAGGRSGDFWWW